MLEETAGLVSCLDVGSWSTAPRKPSKQTYAKNSSISLHVWQQCIATECGWPGCIVGTGLFAPQIRAWRMVYPPEQVAVFTLGELARSPAAALRRLFQFSGLVNIHIPKLALIARTAGPALSHPLALLLLLE